MLFPLLGIIIVGMVLLAIRFRYLNKKEEKSNEDFYERERNASATPKKDLSNIKYIEIPLEKFPIGVIDDPDVQAVESRLRDLSEKDILNLTGKTNTDLKEEYGVPNFDKMKEVGDNFNDLTVVLTDYGSELMLHNMYNEAITVLEYGIVIGTDVSKNYTLLADCYKYNNQPRRIATLREQANNYEGIMKDSILRHLDELLEDTGTEEFNTDTTTNNS